MTELSTDRRFHSLSPEQVETLDQVLTEVIPIHGRGNFPTLEVKPKDIIHMVRDKLMEKEIKVRDVRLNGSTASHVLVKENGTSYKDLDIIFGVELPKQEDFQIIKEVVLRCLLDFLPSGVNKDKITALTMKEAYVQKMVKVFTEHDRWSLISLSNNSGKNVELKFVNSLRRQFEFSVDSFQIILDRMLESYLEAERKKGLWKKNPEGEASVGQTSQLLEAPDGVSATSPDVLEAPNEDAKPSGEADDMLGTNDSLCPFEEVQMQGEEPSHVMEESAVQTVSMEEVTDINLPVPDLQLVSQEETELLVKPEAEGKGVSVLEKETETSDLEVPLQNEASVAENNMLNMETEAHVENCIKVESTDITADSISPVEKTTAEGPVTLKVPCVSLNQPYACHSQEAQDSSIEYPLPPPAKKTFNRSQMVVLKHSSPKPPRKMSKKVTNVQQSPEKTNSVDEHPVLNSQLLEPTKANSEESIPMLVEVADPATSHFHSPANTSQHENCQVKVLEMPATTKTEAPQDNATESQSEVTCLQSQTDETLTRALEAPAQSVEPEDSKPGEDSLHNQIPSMEIPPPLPSLQIPEPAIQIIEPAVNSPDLATQVLPESTAQLLETTVKASEPTAQVPVASSQGQQPSAEVPESTAQPSSRPEIDNQVPEPKEEVLESVVHILEPGAQPEHSQMEATSEGQQTEATTPTRELASITVVAESMYGDFEQAMDHLRYRLIATRNPEEIRGGGLLKYSNLLVREFKPASETEIKTLERYMCSRFFIDFPDVNEQQRKIESYLRNHFIGEEKSKYDYLMTLRRVVNESTVCLMGHERRQTLNMITVLALKVLGEQNIIPNTTNVTCYYQPAPYMADHSFSNYYIAHGQPPLFYQPYPLHIHMQTGLV